MKCKTFQELKCLLGSESNAKIVFISYEHHDKLITEATRKILVHTFLFKKKAQLLKNFIEGKPLDDWMYVIFFNMYKI